MIKLFATIFCLITITTISYGQPFNDYNLGVGLIVLKPKLSPVFMKESLKLYKDSSCKILGILLTPQNTNCPQCIHCEEQESGKYYEGKIQPFLCSGYEGIALICNKKSSHYYEVFIDTLGTKMYVPKNAENLFTTWNSFMIKRAQKGQYFAFN